MQLQGLPAGDRTHVLWIEPTSSGLLDQCSTTELQKLLPTTCHVQASQLDHVNNYVQAGQLNHVQAGQLNHIQAGQLNHVQAGQLNHIQAGQLNHVQAGQLIQCSSLSTGKNKLYVLTCIAEWQICGNMCLFVIWYYWRF